MKVKNVMFTGFAAAVLAFACNSADAAVRLATEELVETKQAKLTADNVTKDGTGKIVTGVTAADVTGLQDALDEKQVKLSVTEGGAINITESGLITLDGIASSEELGNIQDALKVDGQIVTQASQDEKISALETKVGNTSVTETITTALTEGKYVKEGDNVSLLTNDAGYLTETTAETAGFAKTSAIPTTVAQLTDAANYVTDGELTQKGYAVASEVNAALAGKQATIDDLDEIRTGAEAGATAVQPDALDNYVTDGELATLDYATKEQAQSYATTAETNAKNAIGAGVLTVNVNGVSAGTFSANATDASSVNIAVPTTVAQLTDSDDYATKTDVNSKLTAAVPGEGTYLVSSNGTNVTWTSVEIIGGDGQPMTDLQ